MRSEIRELKSEYTQMSKDFSFANETIEELQAKLKNEVVKNSKLAEANDRLRLQLATLEHKFEENETRLVYQEQYSRNANIEIQGVVQEENEDVAQLVVKIGEVISEPISPSDIESCHRVPTRDSSKTNIIVQFKSRAKRNAALRQGKKTRFTNKDIGFEKNTPIYVNEHLCPALKKLLGMTIKRKRDNEWKYAWCWNGKIFAKKADGTDAIQIKNERDLANIC